MRIAIGIAVAGFLGALFRFELGFLFPQHAEGTPFPWATLVINLSGSLLLGLLTGKVSGGNAPAWLGDVLGVGFLGAYTTFSSFNGQLWQLCDNGAYAFAAAYALISGLGGWWLASRGLEWGRGRSA
ncbi:CrcB family protein [Cohnella endophytica]|uniref:Fluoride-specific ion channel FluC n=1 Tax=Cohnella endophytica TaxID=2419778 RepID=A0A494Y480_9BACL|nr:CrcB family protein [Cohnella endophytica]RKP55331.1 CrcB family protein [Cohnella endophytica]